MECEMQESHAGYIKHLNLYVGIKSALESHSTHGISHCESFTESKFDVKYVKIVKSTT